MSTVVLPAAAWREATGLARVVAALGGSADTVRYVGGAVRDTLLGLPVTDVDLATPLRPEMVVARLEASGIKAVPTGIAHGTVTAVADGRPYEVTTLRRDVETDGRRATIAFADDWQEDAARRDFTINALYVDPASGAIFDWFGGLDDLAVRRVRFIGDAGQRIDEDHLRMLRYFRFLARFGAMEQGGAGDADMLAVIAGRAAKLRSLSRERIADELIKLLGVADPVPALRLMLDCGLFAHIAPEIDADAAARVAQLVTGETAIDPALRLIALLPPDAAMADQIAAKLKLSNRLRRRLAVARGQDWPGLAPRPLAYRIGMEGALDRASLAGNGAAMRAALDGWMPPQLPMSGGALIAMGLTEGPAVARTLRTVEDQWVIEGFPDKARVQAIAAALINAR
jgi:poly(A) polymerase